MDYKNTKVPLTGFLSYLENELFRVDRLILYAIFQSHNQFQYIVLHSLLSSSASKVTNSQKVSILPLQVS